MPLHETETIFILVDGLNTKNNVGQADLLAFSMKYNHQTSEPTTLLLFMQIKLKSTKTFEKIYFLKVLNLLRPCHSHVTDTSNITHKLLHTLESIYITVLVDVALQQVIGCLNVSVVGD